MRSVLSPRGAMRRGAGWLLAKWVLLCGLFFIVPWGVAHADQQAVYDPAGRLVGVIDPVNGSAQYTYDATGNILSITRQPITALVVLQFSPQSGAAGASVTIFGTGFDTTADTSVNFNGTPAVPTSVTPTQIVVPVPSGASTGPITVTSPAGTLTTTASFTVGAPQAPTIASVVDAAGSVANPGDTITISGSNFDPVLANNKVFVNNEFAIVTAASPTSLTATVPFAASGRVAVETPAGTAVAPSDLIVAPPGFTAANVISAQRVTLGQAAAAVTVNPSTNVFLVLFDATKGQLLDTLVESNGATTAAIYGPNDAAIPTPDGPGTGGLAFSAGGSFTGRIVAPQTGTYVVAVSCCGGNPTVTVTPYLVPADSTATLVGGGPGEQVTFTTAGQHGVFTFSGTAGQVVSLFENAESFPSCWWYGWIMNPDGTYLVPPHEGCFGAGWVLNGGEAPATLPQTGTYSNVFIPEVSGSMTCCTGSISAQLFAVPPDATTTLPLDGATVAQFNITVPGQAGDFTFAGTAGGQAALIVAFSSFTSCWTHLTVLNPDGTTLYGPVEACIGGGSFVSNNVFALPQTGTYTLHVAPEMGTGTVEAKGWIVPAPITTTATVGGSAASLNFTAPGELGSITFAGSAGQSVSLLLNFSQLASCWTHYSILNPDGTALAGPIDTCFGASFQSSPYLLPQSGTYTITLSPDQAWNAIGAISAQLFAVPANATATISIGGPPTQVSLTVPGQQGTVTFAGTSGQSMTLLLDTAQIASCWTFFSLLNPDGTALISRTETCSSGYSSGTLTLSQTGTYTLTLAPDLTAGGSTTTGTGTITVTAISGGS